MPQFLDIENNPLTEGDFVQCMRYNLGRCKVVKINKEFFYESVETGEKVSWLKMVDANTELQKVKKL
jgi:hypothetical protein